MVLLRESWQQGKSTPPRAGMAAMVPEPPYAEDIETRRRTRVAILAGLLPQRYVPPTSALGYVTGAQFYGRSRAQDLADMNGSA